jgi:phosphoribosylanthranilate isomerase
MPVRIKICGIRDASDAGVASSAGADAVGFILAPAKRHIDLDQVRAIAAGLPPFVTTVGVFVNAPPAEVDRIAGALRLGAVQLHGDEPPEACAYLRDRGHIVIKALRVRDRLDEASLSRYHAASALLLDTYVEGAAGGTGQTFRWELAAGLSRRFRIILAGGLTPGNVAAALETLRPYGVDVTSGVETEGQKDPAKVRAFVERVRAWEATGAVPGLRR